MEPCGAESAVQSVSSPGHRTVIVRAIYRPAAALVARGLELIDEQLQAAVATDKPVIAMGDINIKGTSPALKKPSKIPEIYVKNIG